MAKLGKPLKRVLCYIGTTLLLVFHLMTGVIGMPGCGEYLLVAKPHPSLLKNIPNMEERSWKEKAISGEIPEWVVHGHYRVLGHGSHEERAAAWELPYFLSFLALMAGLIVSAGMLVSSYRHVFLRER